MPDSLRGQLLIAAPQLVDYFRRTVVLVLEHTEEGAMGLVLNRPTDATIGETVPQLSELVDEADPVLAGGPVEPDAVLVLGDFEDPADAGSPVSGSIGLLDPKRPGAEVRRARVYAGYSGWAPGQLDEEIAQDAWIVTAVEPDDPFTAADLWVEVLQRKGGAFSLMTTMPVDPTLN